MERLNYLLLTLIIFFTASSNATVRYVTNLSVSGAGSYSEEITTSSPGDTILIKVTGAVNVNNIFINKNLTIIGPGWGLFQVNGASTNARAHNVNAATVKFSGIRFRQYVQDAFWVNNFGSLTLDNCIIEDNVDAVNVGGAAIKLDANCNLTLENSAVINNLATFGAGGNGGAIWIGGGGGIIKVINSTLSGNFASSYGGAIYNNGGSLIIENATITGNTATTDGGGIYSSAGGTADITNTILAYNTATTNNNIAGTVISAEYSCTNENLGGPWASATNLINTNPQLSTLRFFRGSYVHTLIGTSPCIDAGFDAAPPIYDQKGAPRLLDGDGSGIAIDMGAVEYTPFRVINTNSSGPGSLQDVTDSAYGGSPGTIGRRYIEFDIPGAGPHIILPNNILRLRDFRIDVDGYTQSGAYPPYYEIMANILIGVRSTAPAIGFEIATAGADSSSISGLAIGDYSGPGDAAIYVTTSDVHIWGNHIGVLPDGSSLFTNETGIIIAPGAERILIGGSSPYRRNVISGNSLRQIYLRAGTDHKIYGNYIGPRADGLTAIGGGTDGIYITSGGGVISGLMIGGPDEGQGNVISGNGQHGINFSDVNPTGTIIAGNNIGLDKNGTSDIANGFDGIRIAGASNIQIGGNTTAYRNYIGANTGTGLTITNGAVDSSSYNLVYNNYFGCDTSGTSVISNSGNNITINGGSTYNEIGGNGIGNVIVGAVANNGIYVNDAGTDSNSIKGNYIGIGANGVDSIPNLTGILIQSGAANNTIGGLVSGEGNYIGHNIVRGIWFNNAGGGNTIQGNYVGLDINGDDAGNSYMGIHIVNGSSNTIIQENYIGSNANYGIELSGSNNTTIIGNIIGLNQLDALRPNQSGGINVQTDADYTYIGDGTAAGANTVSAHPNALLIYSSHNSIDYNYIGTDPNGLNDLGNVAGIYGTLDSSIITNNIIAGNNIGITLTNSIRNVISNNKIGLDVNGDSLGNNGAGIYFSGNSIGNVIGGNVISGNNGSGINIAGVSTNDTIIGNIIGLDPTSTTVISNSNYGIECLDASSTSLVIGGSSAGERNVISGNFIGINLAGSHHKIKGNSIGSDPTGSLNFGNIQYGIYSEADTTEIGGFNLADSNIIAFNGVEGIRLYNGALGNQILHNCIHDHGNLGIQLLTGTNADIPIPVLKNPSDCGGGNTIVNGTASGLIPYRDHLIEFYLIPNGQENPSGYGEGNYWLDTLYVTSDVSGNISFTDTLSSILNDSDWVTATITDLVAFNTSEFAQNKRVISAPTIVGYNGVLPNCPADSSGSDTVLVTGGSGYFTYLWNTGAATFYIDNIDTGVYNVVVADTLIGCTVVGMNDTINAVSAGIVIDSILTDSVLCYGDSTGKIRVYATGTSLTYLWDDNGGFLTPWTTVGDSSTLVPQGTWYVRVVDGSGCTLEDTITIYEPASSLFAITDSSYDDSCHQSGTGILVGHEVGGVAPYIYQWYEINLGIPVAALDSATGIDSGSYRFVVTDAHACVDTSLTIRTVDDPDSLYATTSVTDESCFGTYDGADTATPFGGTPPYWYSWDGGAFVTDSFIYGLSVDTISLTLRDANNCLFALPIEDTINAISNLIFDSLVMRPENCFGDSLGIAKVFVSGTSPNYYWYTDAALTNLLPVPTTRDSIFYHADTAFVRVIDGLCQGDSFIVVQSPFPLTAVLKDSSSISCRGLNDGLLVADTTIAANGGTSPYSIDWLGLSNTYNVLDSVWYAAADTYKMMVTDANGCKDSVENIVIYNPDTLDVRIDSVVDVLCHGGSTGKLYATTYGTGAGSLSYDWKKEGNSGYSVLEDYTTADSGMYRLVVTDANGCIDSTADSLVSHPDTIVVYTLQDSVSCPFGSDGKDSINAITGGISPYTYLWSNGGTGDTAIGLTDSAIVYVTVTDVNGCFVTTENDTVFAQAGLTLDSIVTYDVLCNGDSTGELIVYVSGGTGANTFEWDTDAGFGSPINTGNDSSILSVATRIYFRVTDGVGCQIIDSADVYEPAPLVASIIDTLDVMCNGDSTGVLHADTVSATVGGVSPYTFSWTGTASFSVDSVGTAPAGIYKFVVTDASGCKDSILNISITQPDTLKVIIDSVSNATCYGELTGSAYATVINTGAGGLSFLWKLTGGASTAQTSEDAIGVLDSNSYYLLVTDVNGCQDSTVNGMVSHPTSIVAITISTDATCAGINDGKDTITSISGGIAPYTYLWSNAGGINDSVSGLAATDTLSVLITDANGCTYRTPYDSIGAGPGISILNIDSTDVLCYGVYTGTITITSAPLATTYEIDSVSSAYANAYVASAVTGSHGAGRYFIRVSDGAGCQDTAYIDILEPVSALTAMIDDTSSLSCNGIADGVLIAVNTGLGGTTPYTDFSWLGTSNTYAGQDTVTIAQADTYTLRVTDNNGCMDSITGITLTEPDTLDINSPTQVDVSCYGASDGQLNATLSGAGRGSITYTWKGNNIYNVLNPTNVDSGSYYLHVTDGFCQDSTTVVTVTQPFPIIITTLTTDANCLGVNNGYDTVLTVSGGAGGYSFLWSNGNTTRGADMLGAGDTLSVLVTDANLCTQRSVQDTIFDLGTGLVISSIVPTNVLCFGDYTGAITITSAPAATIYEIDSVSNAYANAYNIGGTSVSSLGAGTYYLRVTDGAGCTDTGSVAITEPLTAVTHSTSVTNPTCYNSNNGSVTIIPSGGTAGYSVDWYATSSYGSNISSANPEINLGDSTLYLEVLDANGCSSRETITVTAPAQENAAFSYSTTSFCNSDAASYTATFTDAMEFYQVSGPGVLTVNATNGTFSPLGMTNGTYVIADSTNCGEKDTVSISITTTPAPTIGIPNDTLCQGTTMMITSDSSGGTWSGIGTPVGNNFLFNPSSSGVHSILYSVGTGCTFDTTITIQVNPTPTIAITGGATYCVGDPVNGLTVALTGASPWTFDVNKNGVDSLNAILSGAATYAITPSGAATYGVDTVYDALGCMGINTSSTTVVINSTPSKPNAGTDPANLCQGDLMPNFNATGVTSATFSWSDALGNTYANGVTIPATPGTIEYYVTQSVGSCQSIADTIVVTINSAPAAPLIAPIFEYCAGDAVNPLTVTAGTDQVSWYSDAGLTNLLTTSASFVPTVTTGINSFFVTLTNTSGCESQASQTDVIVVGGGSVDAGLGGVICAGDSITLNGYADGSGTYTWTNTIEDPLVGDTVVATPGATTTYTLTVVFNAGCTYSDTVTVTIDPLCSFGVWTAFSPDGDGVNDFWEIDGIEGSPENFVGIYNRWGDELVSFENYNNRDVIWDGTDRNGVQLEAGTYFYKIELKVNGRTENGWVQIAR